MTGKKRGRPPKVNTNEKPKFQYHLMKKPKYLSDKRSDSQISTPSVSRASSPQDSEESRRSSTRISQTKSRSRPASSKKQPKQKKITPAYHKTDYFYGSDFEDDNSDNDGNGSSSASNASDLIENESDSEFSLSSYSSLTGAQKQSNSPCVTPEPLWLQDIDLPPLELPETSDDLLVPHEYVLSALSIYEILRRFHSMVRLSPYRFEDFCAALICEEQSMLLAELHIMLLKAILREEDSQQTHFGPLDQKDSVNIVLYLLDNITWPEVLRSYVESDPGFDRNVLHILTTKEYPYTSIEDRLTVLQFLSDQFLTSTTVRDDMLREGPIHYDDHCRICHKLGDLLCCETCPAVFHLECVDPPLADVPTEDWQCALCKIHKIPGVADCVLSQEKQGILCRQSSLGCDRHGRKYWFVCRRLFVEELDGSRMWYYSSVPQLEMLLSRLDKDDMEEYLYSTIMEWKEDIEKQMKVTEDLTNKNKGSKKSHLELLNEKIKQAATDETKSGDEQKSAEESPTKPEAKTVKATPDTGTEVEKRIQTRSTTGSLTPRTFSIDDLRRRSTAISTKKEDLQREIELLSQAFKSPYFKLGMEGGFKTYVNQYNINPTALNKPQRNEDRDKKRHLSHKFSLTPASDFKWTGQLNGTSSTVLSTLKQTLIGFEQNIAPQFMHPNWQKIKRLWSNAISVASCQEDIANITIVFQSCLKNVIFANVWFEQLGHLQLFRITSLEREERKKMEKREKRERDDEEERFRMQYNFVKYTLGLKHQVWKQKGEEYRMHGQLGWLWISSIRKQHVMKHEETRPKQFVVPVLHEGQEKAIKVQPTTHEYLQRNLKASNSTLNSTVLTNVEPLEVPQKFESSFNVSKALTVGGRVYFPKVGPDSKLNNLLKRREKLTDLEIENKLKKDEIKTEKTSDENAVKKTTGNTEQYIEQLLNKIIKSKSGASDSVQTKTTLLKRIQTMKLRYTELQRLSKQYKCYMKDCNTNSNPSTNASTCYSPICMQRAKVKTEMLTLLKKSHTGGTIPKEIMSIISSPTINNDGSPISDESSVSLVDDIRMAIQNATSFDLKSLVEELSKEEETKSSPSKDAVTSPDEKPTIKEEAIKTEIKEESTKETSEKPEPQTPVLKVERSLRTSRGRPPKTPKANQNGAAPIVEEPPEVNLGNLRYNRRFPKIVLPAKATKKEVKYEPELFPDGRTKVYSTNNTKFKIYLKQLPVPTKENEQNTKEQSGFPVPPSFETPDGSYKSILLLPKHELIKLARSGGKNYTNGFHYGAKTNTTVWPYQCPRPLFKTCWMYRTLTLNSYAATALQLRILWTSLRWDDMTVKPTSFDGKHQITTETEIVSLELLKHRYIGRSLERMQFLRRKVVIPLELPKTVRSEFTSTRLGLRKRKRADSPQHTEPQVTEEWIDEDKLELWEIKAYGERQDKPKVLPITRTATGKLPPIKIPESMVNSGKIIIKSEDAKEKLEQQLRAQRNVQIQKRVADMKQDDGTPKQFVQRKVIIKNPDGTTKIINQTVAVAPPPPKPEQKVQIIRNPDGKITVRGLTAGQQLIQTSDGKLHVVNTNPVQKTQTPTASPLVKNIIGNKPTFVAKPIVKTVAPSSNLKVVQVQPSTGETVQKKVISPNLQQLLSPGGSQQKIILNQAPGVQQKVIVGSNILTTQTSAPKQLIIQQPPPQQKIVLAPGTKIVQAGGSTSQTQSQLIIGGQRIIVNTGSTSNLMQQNIATKTIKTVLPTVSVQQPTSQQPSPSTTTNPRTQIVVPTQSLAQQISSGKVQIATLNGQQVLIRQTENNTAVVVGHVKQQSDGPAQVVPIVTQKIGDTVQQPPPPTAVVTVQPSTTTTSNTSSGLPLNVENSLLKGQPPGTVIKCVTAQVIQTQQGPRIVLQGLQGTDFTQQQSALVQQQVKQQLLKAQESNGKHGVLGPTKIYLAIQPSQGTSTVPPPLAPVHTTIQSNEVGSDNAGKDPNDDSFVLTPDYIQQTIKSALQQENLNPEIEEKLLTLQRYQEKQMKSETPTKPDYGMSTNSLDFDEAQNSRGRRKSPSARKRAVPHVDDDDWVVDTPKKRSARPLNHPVEKRPTMTPVTLNTVKETPPQVKQEIVSVKATVQHTYHKQPPPSHHEKETPVKKVPNKQLTTANKQKEQLKKEIHKKRSLLEKDLLSEIQKEVTLELSNKTQQEHSKSKESRATTAVKRKSNKFKEENQITSTSILSESDGGLSPTMNRKATSRGRNSQGKASKKKEKLYCVCQTPYDDSRFYVGCDLCNNWFHGDCVGITEEESNAIDEFVCKECNHARETQELFCLCRQPYDESQFYICCDLCNNWFHGRCVGILQSEAEFIDEYICPNCQRNSSSSVANLKTLDDNEYMELKTLIKSIQNHKSAWPFLEPVDPSEVADYYKVIKEPMDLHTIEDKINNHTYNSLQDFIGDMTKIFDNCRYYNPKESQFYKCAESLEAFFLQNIKQFRENICNPT